MRGRMTVFRNNGLPEELVTAIRDIYIPAKLDVTTEPRREADPKGLDYQACWLGLNGCTVAFRVAKTTPDRPGHFVTLWKRPSLGSEIVPLDSTDGTDFVVVSVDSQGECGKSYRGQFVFNKKVLIEQGIMSRDTKPGKLAFRVFPPWSEDLALESILESQKKSLTIKKTQYMSKSAMKTQNWQLKYFFPIAADGLANVAQVKKLFGGTAPGFVKAGTANEEPAAKK